MLKKSGLGICLKSTKIAVPILTTLHFVHTKYRPMYKKHDKGKYGTCYVVIIDYFMQLINHLGKDIIAIR